jgi:hypothetical protein
MKKCVLCDSLFEDKMDTNICIDCEKELEDLKNRSEWIEYINSLEGSYKEDYVEF